MSEKTTTVRPVLSVENLTTSFKTPEGWKAVIRNISLHVDAGETLATCLPPAKPRCGKSAAVRSA